MNHTEHRSFPTKEAYQSFQNAAKSAQTLAWRVIYTKSRNEKAVADRLIAKGIEAYCPIKRTRKKWSDRYQWVEEPLLRSYCFVRTNAADAQKIFTIPGIVQYVYWLGKPAIIREEEIIEIKNWLETYDHSLIDLRSFKAEDKVAILSGSFENQNATVIKANRNQLMLNLESLGFQLLVNTDQVEIQKI